jgi:hypothetical protein
VALDLGEPIVPTALELACNELGTSTYRFLAGVMASGVAFGPEPEDALAGGW